MKSSEQRILYLFDEIGKIDDKYVAEAMAPEGARIKSAARPRFIRILAIAACIALISVFFIIGVANIAKSLLEEIGGNASFDDAPSYETEDMLYETMTGLDVEFLGSARIYGSPAEIVYDGNVRVIWTYGGGVYYSIALRAHDANTLTDLLRNSGSARVSSQDEYGDFRFYVSHGDGRIESPYLEDNSGRLSVGSLSDYLPEVYPSRALAEFIGSLATRAGG